MQKIIFNRISLLIVLFGLCSIPFVFSNEENLVDEVETLKQYVVEEKFDQAYKHIEKLKWKIYDKQVESKKPELKGRTYINPYFEFQISNPIEEWQIKQIEVTDEVYRKKSRIVQNLLIIENPSSAVELKEHLFVSAYDAEHSLDSGFVSTLELKDNLFLKNFAEKLLSQQQDFLLIEKENDTFGNYAAYRIVLELDIGFDKKARKIQYYVFNRDQKNVLMISFLMDAENYSVYERLFREILGTLRIGNEYDVPMEIIPKSFFDIYLEK